MEAVCFVTSRSASFLSLCPVYANSGYPYLTPNAIACTPTQRRQCSGSTIHSILVHSDGHDCTAKHLPHLHPFQLSREVKAGVQRDPGTPVDDLFGARVSAIVSSASTGDTE